MSEWIKHFLGAITTAMLITVAFLLPTFGEKEKPAKQVGGRNRIFFENNLKKISPEVVLIGNSLLREGVDEEDLSEETGLPTAKLARGGTASAAWYLTIKNVVLKFHKRPRYVLLFFRDTFLTNPTYRVSGRYRHFINNLRDDDETVLQELAYGASPIVLAFERFVPTYRRREETKATIDSFLKDALVAGVLSKGTGEVDDAIGRVFEEKNLDDDVLTKQQLDAEEVTDDKEYSFEEKVGKSFLPHIIEITREAGVQLILVRFKTRRYLVADSEKKEIRRYMRKLKKYLADENVPLLDFAHEPTILKEHFGKGDHLNKKNGEPVFTRLLAQRLNRLLKQNKKSVEHNESFSNRVP